MRTVYTQTDSTHAEISRGRERTRAGRALQLLGFSFYKFVCCCASPMITIITEGVSYTERTRATVQCDAWLSGSLGSQFLFCRHNRSH